MFEILGLIGITMIITNGLITESFRDLLFSKIEFLGRMMECGMCIGFWAGLFYKFAQRESFVNVILFAATISLLSHIVDIVMARIKYGMLRREETETEN